MEDFKKYRAQWTELYAVYAQIFTELQKNRIQFKQLGELYDQGKDKSTALKQVQELYSQRKEVRICKSCASTQTKPSFHRVLKTCV